MFANFSARAASSWAGRGELWQLWWVRTLAVARPGGILITFRDKEDLAYIIILVSYDQFNNGFDISTERKVPKFDF